MGGLELTSYTGYMACALPASVAIILVLSFLQRRQNQNTCGYHRPGLLVPMRFLDGYHDRWSYALCFGAISGIIINVFYGTILCDWDSSDSKTNSTDVYANATQLHDTSDDIGNSMCNNVFLKTLLLHVQSVAVSVVCAPHFLCIASRHTLVAALLGLAYAAYWTVFYILRSIQYAESSDRTLGITFLLMDLPVILCVLGLCGRSVWTLYRCWQTKTIRIQETDNVTEQHQVAHVVKLFDKPKEKGESTETLVERVRLRVKQSPFPHFRLPTRIVCIALVQVVVIYYIGIVVADVGVILHRTLKQFLPDTRITIMKILEGIFVTAEVIGISSSAIYITLFVINYRINLINIYKGKKHIYVAERQPAAKLVAQSLRLPGYQIAYIIWGFLITFIIAWLLVAALTFIVYYAFIEDLLWSTFLSIVKTLSVPLMALAVFYLEVLVVRLWLLQPKVKEEDSHRPLNIDNRHVYEVMSYLLMFSNLVVGLTSALFRMTKSLFLGTVFLGRLDRCLLISGFETMDPGYMAYVGTLLVDNAHNNPVMRTFCALLLRLKCKESEKGRIGLQFLREPRVSSASNSVAVRRWHLAYTLLHNPCLLSQRRLALLLSRSWSQDGQPLGPDQPARPCQACGRPPRHQGQPGDTVVNAPDRPARLEAAGADHFSSPEGTAEPNGLDVSLHGRNLTNVLYLNEERDGSSSKPHYV